MNIFSCIDKKNIEKIIILFISCYLNSNKEKREDLKFFILVDDDIDNQIFIPKFILDKLLIKKIEFKNEWNDILGEFNKNFYKDCVWCKNDMNFSRFLFFDMFPEIDRAIYLDWDMIVQDDIFKLEEDYNDKNNMIISEINDKPILLTIFRSKFNYNPFARKFYKKLYEKIISVINNLEITLEKIKSTKNFNSGFFIVSNDQFSGEKLKTFIRTLITVQKKFECFNFGTQVVQNLINLDNRKYVSKLWNCTPNEKTINDTKIIHWNGLNKPWIDEKDKNFNSIWWHYKLFYDKLNENKNDFSNFMKPDIKQNNDECKNLLSEKIKDKLSDNTSYQSLLLTSNLVFSFLLLTQITDENFFNSNKNCNLIVKSKNRINDNSDNKGKQLQITNGNTKPNRKILSRNTMIRLLRR